MPVREGGSYVADPKTGAETRVEGTLQEDAYRAEPVEPAGAPTAPAPEPEQPDPPAADAPAVPRRSGR